MRNLSEEEVRHLAIQRLAHQVCFSQDVPQEMVQSVFMPLAFMDEENAKNLQAKAESGEVAEIYQFLSEAGPRSINGYPIFMSFKTISNDDLRAVDEMIQKLRAA